MKKLLLVWALLSFGFTAQPQTSFFKQLSGISNLTWGGILSFSDQSFIIGSNPVVKMDSSGNIIWAKQFQGTVDPYAGFFKLRNGDVLINTGDGILRMDTSGTLLFGRAYILLNGMDTMDAKGQASDGGYLIMGTIDTLYRRIALIKTDTTGVPVWSRSYGLDSVILSAQSVIETDDGGFLVIGSYNSIQWPYNRVVTIKLDGNGNVLRGYTILHGESYYGKLFRIDENKFFLPGDGRLMCFDSTGLLMWTRAQTCGYWRGGVVNRDHHLFFTGEAWDDTFSFLYSGSTFEVDTAGQIVRCVHYGDRDTIGLAYMDTLGSEGFIQLGGYFSAPGPHITKRTSQLGGGCNDYLINVGDSLIPDSSVSLTIIQRNENVTIQNYALTLQAISLNDSLICGATGINDYPEQSDPGLLFPNPASGYFTVSGKGIITIEIYNLIGELVELHGEVHSVSTILKAPEAAGIYFVKALIENGYFVQKLIVE